MKEYFTRLTPNFNDWTKPSGNDGKCKLFEQTIYEGRNGFGWEEWLFKDYHNNSKNSEFKCKGFVEALNGKNLLVYRIDRLHLYTKVCNNRENITPGCYYIGYIDNIKRINEFQNREKIERDLMDVNIINSNAIDQMIENSLNIEFMMKDVHVDFHNLFERRIRLARGQYRFGLYDLNQHLNIRF